MFILDLRIGKSISTQYFSFFSPLPPPPWRSYAGFNFFFLNSFFFSQFQYSVWTALGLLDLSATLP